jgi:hypothetical protein
MLEGDEVLDLRRDGLHNGSGLERWSNESAEYDNKRVATSTGRPWGFPAAEGHWVWGIATSHLVHRLSGNRAGVVDQLKCGRSRL